MTMGESPLDLARQYFEPLAGGGRHWDLASVPAVVIGAGTVNAVVLSENIGGAQDTLIVAGIAWQSTDLATTRPQFLVNQRPIIQGNPTNQGRILHGLSASLAELYPLRGSLWTGGPFVVTVLASNTSGVAVTVQARVACYLVPQGVRPAVSDPTNL